MDFNSIPVITVLRALDSTTSTDSQVLAKATKHSARLKVEDPDLSENWRDVVGAGHQKLRKELASSQLSDR